MAEKSIPQPKLPLVKIVQQWEEKHQKKLSEEKTVDLIFSCIAELDQQTLNSFTVCTKLSLSSNFINKIPDIHLKHLEILSLGRNKIRFIKGLDFVGNTLKQLWISYNEIDKLDGLQTLQKLECLYIGNNMISKVEELNKLSALTNVKDVVFKGNPFAIQDGNLAKPIGKDGVEFEAYLADIRKRIATVEIIDGDLVGGKKEEK